MFCPKCGNKNEDNAQYCASCGANLQESRENTDYNNSQNYSQPNNVPNYNNDTPNYNNVPNYNSAPNYNNGTPNYNNGTPNYNNVPNYNNGSPNYNQGDVPSYLGWAIAATLLCCLPFGVVAIVYASQVDSKLRMGNYAGAVDSSNKAKMWCWISFGLGLAWVLIYFFAFLASGI